MARRSVVHGAVSYTISDDDAPPRDLRWWAVLRTRVIDELTQRPPHGPIRVTTRTPHCLPRVGDGGLCGLVARPRDVSAAMLAPGRFTAEVNVEGYLTRTLDGAIDSARRNLTAAAVPPAQSLNVAPGDPLVVPGEAMSRIQFRPGRGVLMERPATTDPDEFTLVDDPVAAPAAAVVPLADAVQDPRPVKVPPWHAAGVPIVLPDQPLHVAQPAVLSGRALRQTSVGNVAVPVDTTQVRIGIAGVWWTFSEIAANSNPPHAPNLVSFAAELSQDHAFGAAVERCTLTPDGVARTLSGPAAGGAREIQVAPWAGLNAAGGDALEIELPNSRERELVVVQGFTAPSLPTLPATVRLRSPLSFPHAAGTAISATPAAGIAATALGTVEREAQRGDRVLFLTSLAGATTNVVLRLENGTPREEMRLARCPPTHSAGTYTHAVPFASDGTFELPPVARVAQLRIQAEHGGQAVLQPIDFVPDYRSGNSLQVLFTP